LRAVEETCQKREDLAEGAEASLLKEVLSHSLSLSLSLTHTHTHTHTQQGAEAALLKEVRTLTVEQISL